jgi:SMI1 / KNR4 family (SUKH-1)
MLEALVEAWRLSSELHELAAGASEAELASAEAELGRSLPEAARALYRLTDGASLLRRNLNVYPLRAAEFGLVAASGWLRSVEWTIPEELVVFGDNGSDDSFGLWLPRGRREDDPAPVIQIAEVGEGFAVAGTSLLPFLTGWSAYYLLLLDSDRSALSALDVPQRLWDAEPSDELFGWADPDLPDPAPDPYGRPVAVSVLRERYGSD